MKRKPAKEKAEVPIFPKVSVNPETKMITTYVQPNSPEETYVRAFLAKTEGKEMTAEARAGIVRELCNSKDWTPWVDLIAALAAARDLQFFKMLGSGLHEGDSRGLGGRSPMFSEVEKYLGSRWHDGPEFPDKQIKLPALKWWRDEAVRTYLSEMFYKDVDGGLDLSAYRSMRDRLDLVPEKNKRVRKIEISRCVKTGTLHIGVT